MGLFLQSAFAMDDMDDFELEDNAGLIKLETTKAHAPSYPRGYGPRASIYKLEFLKTHDNILDVDEKLDIIENYFLCPIFIGNKGYTIFHDVIKFYGLKSRSFPVKKIPAMIYTAMMHDEFVFAPLAAMSLYFVYYAALTNVKDDFLGSVSSAGFPDLHTSCTMCAESWDNTVMPPTPNDINITYNNQTREFRFVKYGNLPSCPEVMEQAQYYAMQALNDATLNESLRSQVLNSYKFASDDFSQFINYKVSCLYGFPDRIITSQCNMSNIISAATSMSSHIGAAVIAIPACTMAYLARLAIGWKCLS